LWELCGHQGLLLAVGTFELSRSFIGGSFFFFVWAHSATFRLEPTTSGLLGGAAAPACHRYGLEVEVEVSLKDFNVIFFC
jgi:hypothetical protein